MKVFMFDCLNTYENTFHLLHCGNVVREPFLYKNVYKEDYQKDLFAEAQGESQLQLRMNAD